MLNIPYKIGHKKYDSIEKKSIKSYMGEELGMCSLVPSVQVDLAKKKYAKYAQTIRNQDIHEIVDIYEKAAEYFKGVVSMGNEEVDFQKYVNLVVQTTGLPVQYVLEGQSVIYYYFKNIASILKSQSPNGLLETYNTNIFKRGEKEIGWVRDGVDVGVISPSNNPTVHTVWMTALAMKSQLFLKPSLDEVFTPLRILQSLEKAGLDESRTFFLPGKHEITSKLISNSSKSILFGAKNTLEQYEKVFPNVKYYGPGSSKLFIDENNDIPKEEIIRHAVEGMMSYGGKGCISLSGIIACKEGMELAEGIVEALSRIEVYQPEDKHARIPAVMNAYLFDGLIQLLKKMVDMGAVNVSEQYQNGEIGTSLHGVNYLRPTVLYMKPDHPLFGMELPFPFVTITTTDKNRARTLLRNSLSVSVISNDQTFYLEMLRDASIQMLHRGLRKNVYDVDPEKPFEGFLSDYLYKIKAI